MSEQEARDILHLHIYLGKKSGYDVSELIEMQQVRYLFSINGLYLNKGERNERIFSVL